MKISEYNILERAFSLSFPFMLNRIWDIYQLPGDPHGKYEVRDEAAERAFTEFMGALEDIGVELEEARVVKGEE